MGGQFGAGGLYHPRDEVLVGVDDRPTVQTVLEVLAIGEFGDGLASFHRPVDGLAIAIGICIVQRLGLSVGREEALKDFVAELHCLASGMEALMIKRVDELLGRHGVVPADTDGIAQVLAVLGLEEVLLGDFVGGGFLSDEMIVYGPPFDQPTSYELSDCTAE